MMRIALICYHKNLYKIYPAHWINEYRDSVLNQTHKDFHVYEINYGGGDERIFNKSNFLSKEFETFNHAQRFLLNYLFELGYDCVYNSNCDDRYAPTWIETMLPWIEKGYDVVSCNFSLFEEGRTIKKHYFDKLNIEDELAKEHNPICHPAIAMSRTYWERGHRYIPEEIPYEDLKLWQRSIKDSRFIILPERLCYHRIHSNSVCQSNNK